MAILYYKKLHGNTVLQEITWQYCITRYYMAILYYKILHGNTVLQEITWQYCITLNVSGLTYCWFAFLSEIDDHTLMFLILNCFLCVLFVVYFHNKICQKYIKFWWPLDSFNDSFLFVLTGMLNFFLLIECGGLSYFRMFIVTEHL